MKDEFRTRTIRSRRAWLFCLLFILHPSSFILGQDIPLVGQPGSDFYGAAGNGVKVAWSVNATEVLEDGEIVATLTITNASNPRKITRPDLKKLAAFNDLFSITDNVDPPAAEGASEVRFSYRLRPRNRQTDKVPTFEFYYFNPAAPVGKQFKLATARPIAITVKASAPKLKPPPMPLTEPDQLFAIATGTSLLSRGSIFSEGLAWLLVAIAGPLLALSWYVAWRRVYLDAQRLAKIRRSRAARRALDAIRRAAHEPDSHAAIAAAVLNYLRSRFPLPPGAVTPTEIGAALTELEMPTADADAVAGFFRKCDAARFSSASDNAVSLVSDAGALIARLEAA
ncbi:MAG: hypothetical protein K8U57_30170 [Planctomycetes bacterium]|nr:hypothetical protein [Planctomycetota bacterium]